MDFSKIFALLVVLLVAEEIVALKCTQASTEKACVKVREQARAMTDAAVCNPATVDFTECETTVDITTKPVCLKCEPMANKQFKPSCLDTCFKRSTSVPVPPTTARPAPPTTKKSTTTTTKSDTATESDTTTKSDTATESDTTTKSDTDTESDTTPKPSVVVPPVKPAVPPVKPVVPPNQSVPSGQTGGGSDVATGGSGSQKEKGDLGQPGLRMRRDMTADTNCYKACSTDAPKPNLPNSNNSTGADAAFNVGQTLSFARIVFSSLALVMAVKVIAA